ncbi:hypothetical protein SAMD00019534_047820 [Acytostelium subglobosum LB1]|uniref:hypothetical protein n=1 Tax=Acytostelium subglobosum LB1 TaxID=1410327 RepID=UPI000644E941|nr:hypothetical protein SAMD00019534_047820 [Acytostelium subglobosum LB1]GAM21607.1 hypothetical protein SAMD00019534_047820 [Acytostelium subglobosum LB1]|eukprot:XP_012755726.1 hypothetical protein SAMD00019534_047820 [Acytostelium subglobosum LB1]
MSNPTLYYFDARARAETSRLLFVYAGAKFNDNRSGFPLAEDVRSKTPFGQVPFLEDGDTQLAQSIAIESYLAEKFKLNGTTLTERAQVLQFALVPGDFYAPYFAAKDDAANLKFKEETAPKLFKKLEDILFKKGGQHFVGNTLTWADISIFNLIDFFHQQHSNLVEAVQPFPTLLAFHKQVAAIPQFAEYLKNRPTTRL